MASKDSNFDKVILSLVALAGLAGAGYVYILSGGMPEQLAVTKVRPSAVLPEVPIDDVKKALTKLTSDPEWSETVVGGKPVPLFKSIIVVQKDGNAFDLYQPEPKFREPITNEFLLNYGLDFLSPNVAELDPDEDGFSNLEEFMAKTDPKDKKAHPPLTDHLYLVERVQDDYVLAMFGNASPYTVRRIKPGAARSVLISTFPQDFGFEPNGATRFRALSFELKTAVDPKSNLPTDVSEMKLLDTSSNTEFVLVNRKESNLAAYQAKLQFRHGTVQNLTVKKGESFRITGIGSTFKLDDVQPDAAKVTESVDGAPAKSLLIKLKP
jgi:hypothetical protein